ncbi:hypothetical protein [Mucilaginibacter sp. dw_454]|uniref:hypothetical protein n=1 Tax=Mucilaginibacter sp. dw_454 TaxID=2720079 RepID=UPI001BD63FC5|nr:hypothetical protein [Mucilaginibacter sp. dw_454]
METSTIKRFKAAASRMTEDRILHAGHVLEVRPWDGGTITEIDLHLPTVDMHTWQAVPYIKFKVANFTYRDYTPFGWDAETSTCSLLIDTGHNGPGSLWARKLQANEKVQYLKIDSTRQIPHATDLVVGLGDSTSLAHLLALQQLTLPISRFAGAAFLPDRTQKKLFGEYFRSPLQILSNLGEVEEWVAEQGYCIEHSHFYLTGHEGLVTKLRQRLKTIGHQQIRVKGFWS